MLEVVTFGETSVEDDEYVLVADAESVEDVTLSAAEDSVLDETSLAVESVAEALDENGVGAGVTDSADEESIVEETSFAEEELLGASLPLEVDSAEALVVGNSVSATEVCDVEASTGSVELADPDAVELVVSKEELETEVWVSKDVLVA